MESAKVYGNKYCAFELDGEAKYYMCPRNEYCCNFGCCVNLAFQFYQLWYYWLLIIIMFMICSGGGWWYRFCRQNDSNSTYPSVSQNLNHSYNSNRSTTNNRDLHQRNANELSRRSRVSSSHHRTRSNQSQFYIQPIWKGPSNQNIQLPPSYYSSTTQYSLQQQQFHQECPYHQLYGPPPSYDSVIQLTDTSGNGQTTCTLMTNTTTISPTTNQHPHTHVDSENSSSQIETNNSSATTAVAAQQTDSVSIDDEPSTSSLSLQQHDTINFKNLKNSLELETKDDNYYTVNGGGNTATDSNRKQFSETIFNTIPSTSKSKNNSKISPV